MPKIHLSDSVYEKLKELATEQNRSIANMAETILSNVWGKQPADPKLRSEWTDPVLIPTPIKTKEEAQELLNLVKGKEPAEYKNLDKLACKHEDVNKRNGICNNCGEYTR